MYSLKWRVKDHAGNHATLYGVSFTEFFFESGVYIIWYLKYGNRVTVYAGQGTIKNRIYSHRGDPRIRDYASNTLFVAWAEVPKTKRYSIEAFLHKELQPRVLGSSPNITPERVNLPWD